MVKGVGKRIKELRLERDLSLDMLVADMNHKYLIELEKPLNKSMVSRWESDIHNPSLDNAKLICDYFDVSLDYLIGLTDTRTPLRLLTYASALRKMSASDTVKENKIQTVKEKTHEKGQRNGNNS